MWPFSSPDRSKLTKLEFNALLSLRNKIDDALDELEKIDKQALPVEARLEAEELPVVDSKKQVRAVLTGVAERTALRELDRKKKTALASVVVYSKDFAKKYGG